MQAPAPPAFLPSRFTCVPAPPAFPARLRSRLTASPAFLPHRPPFHLHGVYFTLAARSRFRFTVPRSQPAALLPPPAAAGRLCRTVSVLRGMCGYSSCEGGK